MKRKLAAGLTSATMPIWVQDTTSTTGAGLGSLVFNSAGLVGEYRRQGQSTWTAITLAAGTLGTYSSGGWIADGSLAGAYEVGIPDAALATGARWVAIRYRGATNMLPVLIEVELDAVNYQDSVRFGLTALPNAAANASGGVYTIGGTGVAVATNSDKTGYSLTATTGLGNQTANITGNLSGSVGSVTGAVGSVTAAVTVGTINANVITATSIAAAALNGKGDWNIGKTGYALTATTGLGNQTANITGNLSGSVGSVTGNVGGSVASVTGAVGSVTGNVGGNVVGSVASVTNAVTVGTINANTITAASIAASALNGKGDWNVGKTGYSLAGAGLDSIVVETGLNARQALSVIAASAAGTLNGAATTTITIDGAGVATDRIVATVDANGNRTAVTLSPPA